jgi:NADH dehydrogenase [ubiquinone] 1 alpha subcomplex assembly factor 1
MKALAQLTTLLWSMASSATLPDSTLLDFNSGEPAWYVRNDAVMGGVSSSRLQVSGGVLTFSGRVRLENNGGFSGVRSRPGLYDLSGFSSVVLRVKGDGKRYALQLGNSAASGVTYRGEFGTVAGQWTEIVMPLSSLRPTRSGERVRGPALDARRVTFFGLVIGNGRAENFALEVDWIRGRLPVAPLSSAGIECPGMDDVSTTPPPADPTPGKLQPGQKVASQIRSRPTQFMLGVVQPGGDTVLWMTMIDTAGVVSMFPQVRVKPGSPVPVRGDEFPCPEKYAALLD